jgi:hypothetical protein
VRPPGRAGAGCCSDKNSEKAAADLVQIATGLPTLLKAETSLPRSLHAQG